MIANFCQALQENSGKSGYGVQSNDLMMQYERDIDLEQVLYQLNIQNVRLTQEYETLTKEIVNEDVHNNVEENGSEIKTYSTAATENDFKEENITNSRTLKDQNSENDGSDEASKLRQHTNRMETRIAILVDHNKQLDSQLKRLRQLVQLPDDIADGSCGSRFGTLRSKVVRATSLQNEKSQEFDSGIICHCLFISGVFLILITHIITF